MLFATPWSFRPRNVSSASSGLSSTSRISISSNSSNAPLPGQREVERRALAGLRVRPKPTAMPCHDSVNQREPDSGAGKLVAVMQALKHAEQLVGVTRIVADAVVADEVDVLALFVDRANLDDGMILARRELDRVRQEVHPHLLEQAAVADRFRKRAHLERRTIAAVAAVAVAVAEPAEHVAHDLAHVELGPIERLAAQAREREQVVDQRAHALGLGADHA